MVRTRRSRRSSRNEDNRAENQPDAGGSRARVVRTRRSRRRAQNQDNRAENQPVAPGSIARNQENQQDAPESSAGPPIREQSYHSVKGWIYMHDYLTSVERFEREKARLAELQRELDRTRQSRDQHQQQAQIELEKIRSLDALMVLEKADVPCIMKLHDDGFRGRLEAPRSRTIEAGLNDLARRGFRVQRT